VRRCVEALRAAGLDDGAVARLRAPVGLDLGAETHGEIAVAVVAEMVRVRRRGDSDAGGQRSRTALPASAPGPDA
jgi:xanthine dehydrogenase accessory factor